MKRQNWVIVGLLALGWIVFLGQPGRVSRALRVFLVHLATPFVKLGDSIPVVRERRDWARENDRLRRENDLLRQQVFGFGETGRENLRLHQLLEMKERLPQKPVGARVISRDSSNWWRSLQIDRGSEDGIRVNQAVVNADGVIGKIIFVTRGDARVLLLTDPGCKASALLQGSRQPGIVSGVEAATPGEPPCVMTFVDRQARIKNGEWVVTSGLGGVFPKGIPVGTVLSAHVNPQTGMYLDVALKPAVDFQRLEEVLVVTE